MAQSLAAGTRVRVRDLKTIKGGHFSTQYGRVIYPPGDSRSLSPQSHVVELDGPFCYLSRGRGTRPRVPWVVSNDVEEVGLGEV